MNITHSLFGHSYRLHIWYKDSVADKQIHPRASGKLIQEGKKRAWNMAFYF